MSGFALTLLTTLMATHHNTLRLFEELRLSPWEPEHAVWIAKELAAREIDDPENAKRFREKYEAKMEAYQAEHPELFVPKKPKKEKEPKKEEEVSEPEAEGIPEMAAEEAPTEEPKKKKSKKSSQTEA